MKIFIYVFTVLFVSSQLLFAQNPLGPLYTINGAGSVSIDGDVSDWSNAEWVTYGASTVAGTGGMDWNGTDAVCTFAMMYDGEALYCAAQVEDDINSYNVANTTPHAWWERDGLQWFIDFTGNPEQEILLYPDFFEGFENDGGINWLPGEMIIAIGATEDQTDTTTRRWPIGTRDGSRSDNTDFALADGTLVRSEVNEAWESVVVLDGANYTVEVRIPWESLETSIYYSDPEDPSSLAPEALDELGWNPMLPDPLVGSTILLTHLLIDVDNPDGGFDSQVMWVGDGDNDMNWSTATFAEITPVHVWELY